MKLVSACLLGVPCRYDRKSKANKKVLELMKTETLIPICPEQLGGLPTPRIAAEQKVDDVFTKKGKNVTIEFNAGAKEALNIAKLYGIKEAILKSKSPSCGNNLIYDGTFTGTLIKGDGVCSALLKKNGIKIINEKSYEKNIYYWN